MFAKRWTLLLALGLWGCGGSGGDDRADGWPPPRDGSDLDGLTRDGGIDAWMPSESGPATDGGVEVSLSTDVAIDVARADVAIPRASPEMRGPHGLVETMAQVMRESRRIPITIIRPNTGGPFPLVLFLPGFQLQSRQYRGTLEHLASHGFVVIGADPPTGGFNPSHLEMAADGRAVIDWALAMSPFSSAIDREQIGVTGHSLGGKLATMIAISESRVRALYAIDPVDGDPSPFGGGSAERPDIIPSRGAEIRIPAGFAGETTNGRPMGFGGMACAPEDQNFQQFFNAATMAPWVAQWNFLGADHMDFLDSTAGCFVCGFCPDGPADDAMVLSANRTLITAFFRRHLRGELAMEEYLRGSRLPPNVRVMARP
ncbi:MAG: alpha/beta fold hydrolase [Sandaracinaceae bacterium]|nr:alpha/beta fold hydrolase [Sandaracinaceae bacterium]MDW8246220.1 alpha/beta fold hydrolase [Sandaracinaceae bacterium]